MIKDGGMIGTAVSASLVSLLGVVGATIKVIDNLRKYKNRNSKFRRKI